MAVPAGEVSASRDTDPLRAFRARCEAYRRHGFDRLDAARFVVRAAGGLEGPALDIGTGKGTCAIALARLGLDVVSIDPDGDEQVTAAALAAEAGVADRIHFVRSDTVYLDFPDGYFGSAAMVGVLHHLDAPEPVLREMARVVRPGGRIVVADFDERGFELVARVLREEGREHTRTATTVEDSVRALEALGFRSEGDTNGHLFDVAVLIKS